MAERNNDMNPFTAADIEKYWKGELTPVEMHTMERAALDDPFLADAMEGYQHLHQIPAASAGRDLAGLEYQLHKRISGQKKSNAKSFTWWKPAIAALLLFTAGVAAYFLLNPEPHTDIAITNKPVVEPVTITPAGHDSLRPADTIEVLPADIAVLDKDKKKTPVIRQTIPPHARENKKELEDPGAPTETAPAEPENRLEKAAGKAPEATTAKPVTALAKKEIILFDYSGVVLDEIKKPVEGAIVNLKGKVAGVSVVTDTAGRFLVPIADSVVQLTVSSTGYLSDKYQLSITDSTNNITINLKPSNVALNEVVVSGYSNKKKTSDIAASETTKDLSVKEQDAVPVPGWNEFNTYLQQKQLVPDSLKNNKGNVVLSFVVATNGRLSSFIVEQSLQPDLDREAIRLVKAGPAWKVLKGRKARVIVIVPF